LFSPHQVEALTLGKVKVHIWDLRRQPYYRSFFLPLSHSVEKLPLYKEYITILFTLFHTGKLRNGKKKGNNSNFSNILYIYIDIILSWVLKITNVEQTPGEEMKNETV
jgi:hypothetical protein